MKVFISWSGDQSKKVAVALKNWLPNVFQEIKVWMSEQDIQAGKAWGIELGKALRECKVGIICLTPENLKSNWMLFEAGALSTAMENSSVIPYRFQLKSIDVGPPLSLFQGVDADEEGTYKLVKSINCAFAEPKFNDASLNKFFQKWWEDLRVELDEAKIIVTNRKIRTDRELLEEILNIERQEGIHDLSVRLMQILTAPNVSRVEVAPKEIGGKQMKTLALRITVKRKIPKDEIPIDELIPSSIFGMLTDVVEELDKASLKKEY